MTTTPPTCHLVEDATQALLKWAQNVRRQADSEFEAARQLVTRLGAHLHDGLAEVGFWAPELVDQKVDPANIYLEILHPEGELDLQADELDIRFHRQRIRLAQDGEFVWGVIAGMQAGTRDRLGSFYWLKYINTLGQWETITDYVAYSVPYGVLAPAEFYDLDAMHAARPDREHFSRLDVQPDPDSVPRVQPPTNILQIHPGTASEEGTLAGLTRVYSTIAGKIRAGERLTPAEENYIAYDAVELMPVEPPIEHEQGPLFWETLEDEPDAGHIIVKLRKHDIIDWGYDVMVSASPATNPAVLSSKRPDELVDFIAALHNFPGKPIKVMFDIVYGHTDNQALAIFPPQFLAGPNMYGQNLNYLNPVARALLLEMQRRKHDVGVDGIRVDGAQDFKWWDPATDTMIHDDDYLTLMNFVEQEVAGQRYRPWMIFEDGRPWPRDDWELASTYREVTKLHDNVWQWGPLTFAHNTPFLFTFWISKWWRIVEMTQVGNRWITGCANHDTLRRGTQVDPNARINTYLGNSLPEIFNNAYDNPAAKLFDYAMMPGIPMDFINASMRGPWGFIRNTDDKYGVKVVSEEARFSRWVMTQELFNDEALFPRLKALGFTDLNELRRFMHTLDHVVQATDYDLEAILMMLQSTLPPLPGRPLSVMKLKEFAQAWMEDVHEFCNVSHYYDKQIPERTTFNLAVREFRRQRPWLMENLRDDEFFDHLRPCDGTVLFFGLRRSPEGDEEFLFVANMEGAPRTITPLELPIPNLPQDGWEVVLQAPFMKTIARADQPLTLHDSQAVVFRRVPA